MSDRIVTVRLVRLVGEDELHPDDQGLPLEFAVEVDEEVRADWIANAALDVFHEENGIKVLEDFDFQVWFDGEQIFPDYSDRGPEEYALLDQARSL